MGQTSTQFVSPVLSNCLFVFSIEKFVIHQSRYIVANVVLRAFQIWFGLSVDPTRFEMRLLKIRLPISTATPIVIYVHIISYLAD